MNLKLVLTHRRTNPLWLRQLARSISLFRFYRMLGYDRRASWDKVARTL